MGHENVIYDVKNNIGFLTINRPKSLNALNGKTIDEIRDVLAEIKKDDQVRVIIVTGSGDKAFVAGADVTEFEKVGIDKGFDFSRNGQQMGRDIEWLGKPSIAAVNGLALGGGLELALSCTFRILSENAQLGLPEVGLGVIPGYGGTQKLARVIGKSRALWAMLTGDFINARDALDMGLANMVVTHEELMETALKVAGKILKKAPLAVKMAIMAVNHGSEIDLESALIYESAFANLLLISKDKEEGIKALMEKRKPNFTGK